jgi:DNA segregation ATPase FtsK/SpoIIIE-like protein
MERKIVVGYEEEANKEVIYDPDTWHVFLMSGREGYGRLDLLKKLTLDLVCGSKAEFYLFGDVFFAFVYPDADCAKLHVSSEKERIVAYLNGLVQTMEQRFAWLEEKGFPTLTQANAQETDQAKIVEPIYVIFDDLDYYLLRFSAHDRKAGESIRLSLLRLAQRGRAVGIHLILSMTHADGQFIGEEMRGNILKHAVFAFKESEDSLEDDAKQRFLGRGEFCLIDCVGKRKETLCSLENSDPTRYDSSEKELYERVKEAAKRWGNYTTIIRIQRTFDIGFPKAGMCYARLQAEGIIGTDNGKIG